MGKEDTSKREDDDLLSAAQCAEEKGVTRQAILTAIRRGALPAKRVGNSFVIKWTDCKAYLPVKDPSEKGVMGNAVKWKDHVKEEKPKRPRGRPPKK